MKNLIKKAVFCFCFIGLFLACEEDINSSADFRERFVLSSMINADSDFQVLTLTRTYDNNKEGIDPDWDDIFVDDAEITLWYNDSAYRFRDTTVIGEDYKKRKFYYSNKLSPKSDYFIEVEAVTKNGLVLKAETIVPKMAYLRREHSTLGLTFPQYLSTASYHWEPTENIIVFPYLQIKYFKSVDGVVDSTRITVPIEYTTNGGKEFPVYPKGSDKNYVIYDMDVVHKTLEKISEGDDNKKNYRIIDAEFILITLDSPLSIYYSTTQQFLDSFTIIVDAPDYSNVIGGMGIFGAYTKKIYPVNISKDYILSFGYLTYK